MPKYLEQFDDYITRLANKVGVGKDVYGISKKDIVDVSKDFFKETKSIDHALETFLKEQITQLNSDNITAKEFMKNMKNQHDLALYITKGEASEKNALADNLEKYIHKKLNFINKEVGTILLNDLDIINRSKTLHEPGKGISQATLDHAVRQAQAIFKTLPSNIDGKNENLQAEPDRRKALDDYREAQRIENNLDNLAGKTKDKKDLIYKMIKGYDSDFSVHENNTDYAGHKEIDQNKFNHLKAAATKLGLGFTAKNTDPQKGELILSDHGEKIIIPVIFADNKVGRTK